MRTHRRRPTVLVTAVLVGTISAVSGSIALAADQAVSIADFAFSPASVTIQVGDVVTWTNGDAVGHTATATGGAWDTGTLSPGATGSVTFDTAGTFAYRCTIHPSMTGSVVVEAAPPSAPPSTPPSAAPSTTPSAAPSVAPTTGPTNAPTAPSTDSVTPTATPPTDDPLGSASVAAALAALAAVAAIGALLALRVRPTEVDDPD